MGTVTDADRAEVARLLEASTQRGQAKVERVRTHKNREDKHRQQREIERRNREAKAARKAEHERAARGHQGPRSAPGRRSPRPRVTSGYRIVPTPPRLRRCRASSSERGAGSCRPTRKYRPNRSNRVA